MTLPAPVAGKQLYRKVRERSSYAFALVSIAAVVELQHGKFTRADLAFGGLAHKPWHDPRIADALIGPASSDDLYDTAADLLLEDAQGHGENEFKIPLGARPAARGVEAGRGGSGMSAHLKQDEPDTANRLDQMKQGVIGQPIRVSKGWPRSPAPRPMQPNIRSKAASKASLPPSTITRGEVVSVDKRQRDGMPGVIAKSRIRE